MKYPLQYLCLLLAILFTNANSAFANGFEQQVGQLQYADGSLPLGLIAVYKQNGMHLYVYQNGYDVVLYRNLGLPATVQPRTPIDAFQIAASRVSVKWKGTNTPLVQWNEPQPQALHFYTDNATEQGYHPNSFNSITLTDVYPGIHVQWQITASGQIKYEWHLEPGADASRIQWSQKGAKVQWQADRMRMTLPEGTVEDVLGPVYHTHHNQPVSATWQQYSDESYGFNILNRDPQSGLVIDPGIVWSTYYGSPDVEVLTAMKVHADGRVSSAGFTTGSLFPVMQAFQQTFSGNIDACVFQLDASGQRLWSTYFGGTGFDRIHDLAISAAGDIAICGESSGSIPVSPAAFQQTNAGGSDAFVASFNPQGVRNWSTHFGGSSDDYAYGICLDQQNRMYVTGGSQSANLPVLNGHQPVKAGSALTADAFVVQFTISGSPGWGTYLGGNDNDFAYAIAADPFQRIVITGATGSTGFPVLNATQNQIGGGSDIFMSQFNTLGQLQWSSFMGGQGNESAEAIAIDANGSILIGGYTDGNFPVQNAFQSQYGGGDEDMVFISVNGIGQILWAGYYGGGDAERVTDIAVDSVGQWLIVGYCNGAQFPVYYGHQSASAGNDDAVYVWLQADGKPVWASYLGGTEADYAYAAGIGTGREVYIGGLTASINFPVANALQAQNATSTPQAPTQDIFISRFCQSYARISGNYSICAGGVQLPVQLSGNGPWAIIYTDGTAVFQVTGITALPYALPVNPTVSTTYRLIQSFDLSGCRYGYVSGSAQVDVVQATPGISLMGLDTICPGATANLTFHLTGPGPWDFQYSDGLNTYSVSGVSVSPHILPVSPTASITYTPLSVTTACGIASGTGVSMLFVDSVALPHASVPASFAMCPGDTDSVAVHLSGAQPWHLHWSAGTQNVSVSGISVSPFLMPVNGVYGLMYTLNAVENICGTKALSSLLQIDTLPTPISAWSFISDTLTVQFSNQSQYALQWLWRFGDGMSDTLQNPSHTYLNAGTYIVQCIVSNACGSDTLEQAVTVSIPISNTSDIENQIMRVYPNPSSGGFYIVGNMELSDLTLYDLQGRKMALRLEEVDSEKHYFEMKDAATGMYILQAGTQVFRLQVQVP